MDYRAGKCSQCGAEYKIPASFAHNVARCKRCSGVVHLSPANPAQGVPSAARGPVPPKPVPPRMSAPEEAAPRVTGASLVPSAPPAASGDALRPSDADGTARPSASSKPAAAPRASSPRPVGPTRDHHRSAEDSRSPSDRKRSAAGIAWVLGVVAAAALLIVFRKQIFGDPVAPTASSTGAPRTVSPSTAPSTVVPSGSVPASTDPGRAAHVPARATNPATREPAEAGAHASPYPGATGTE